MVSVAQQEQVTVQQEQVTVRKTYSPRTEESNCSLCGDLCIGHLCVDCADDGSDSLAALADAVASEPRSDLDEAIEIASGESLMLPEKRHLVALYELAQQFFRESLPAMRKARLELQNECLEYAEVNLAQ